MGGSTQKTRHQMFSVHTRPEESKKARKTRSGKSHDDRDAIVFEEVCFQFFSVYTKSAKPAFSNSSGLESVVEKFLCDGLAIVTD